MDVLKGQASFTEQDREQRYLEALGSDIEAASELLGKNKDEIIKDVKDNTGGFKLFGVIPTPLDSDINVEETKQWLKTSVKKKMVEDYGAYLEQGGEVIPEEQDFITKLDASLNKTVFDRVGEGLGDAAAGIGDFLDSAKTALSSDEGRKTIMGSVTQAVQSGYQDPASFFDALATLSADAFIDQVPTGIFKTAKDINQTVTGELRPYDVSMNLVQKSPFSGSDTATLAKEQPAAAFISFMVPYILAGGWKKAAFKSENALTKLQSGAYNSTIGKLTKSEGLKSALDLATAETVFDTATGSVNTVGDTVKDRNKVRGANSILTFFSGLGIDLAGGGLHKIYKGMVKNMPEKEAIKATTETVRQRLMSVLNGEQPISVKSINDHLETYGVPIEEQPALKYDEFEYSPVYKMNASQMVKHIESGAAYKELIDAGLPESVVNENLQKAAAALNKPKTKLVTPQERKELLLEARTYLTHNIDRVEPTVMPGSVDDAIAKTETVNARLGVDNEVAEFQQSRSDTLPDEADANTTADKEFKKELTDDGVDPLDAESSDLPDTQPGMPFDGNTFDLHARALSKFGLATPGFLMFQTERFKMATMAYITAHQWSGRIIRGAYQEGYKIKDLVGKMVGTDANGFTKKYLRSGLYRAWAEGLEVPLTDQELDAFKKLQELDLEYNKNYNLPVIEETGMDTKNFNPEAFTDSTRGTKMVTLDLKDPALRAEVEAAGYQVTSIRPTKSNPKLKERDFVFINFGKSGNEIINNLQEGKVYYQQKAPFLFDEAGNLRTDLFKVEHNPTKELFELANEKTLTPDQITGIANKLLEAGYDPASVGKLKQAVGANGNVDTSLFKTKANRVFEGSLQNKSNSKIGVNLDVIESRTQQNVRLSKKVFKDVVSDKVGEVKKEINKIIVSGADLTDQQRYALVSEKHALDFFQDTYVLNKPGAIEKLLLGAVDIVSDVKDTTATALKNTDNRITKLSGQWLENVGDGRSAFQTLRDWSDQHLAIQSMLKLSLNVAGSAGNILEALSTSADQVLNFDMPDKYWKELFNGAKNPIGFVKSAEEKMAKTSYKNFYLDSKYDSSVDTRFLGKRNLAKKLTDNPVSNVTMAPFTGSIRWGKAFVYNLFEQVGKARGLESYALEDFIFESMVKRGQVGELNTPMLAKNDFALKSMLFLKNFMFVTSEYETNAWTRSIGSTIGGKPDKEAIKEMLAFTGTRTLLLGAGASPTISLLNQVMNLGTGGQVNPLQQERAKGSFISHGIVGELTGMSTEQLHIDALASLANTPIAVNTAANAAEYFNASANGIELLAAGKTQAGLKLLGLGLEDYIAKEVTAAGRLKKAYNVGKNGELRTNAGSLVQRDIKNKPVVALQALMGFNPSVVDEDYALEESTRKTLEAQKKQDERVIKTFTKLASEGTPNADKAAADLLETKGTNLTDKQLENAIEKSQMTRKEKIMQDLSDKEIMELKESNPEAYQLLYGDDTDEEVNKYEQ